MMPIKMWTKGVHVDDKAEMQLVNIAKMPFIFKHVAAMPRLGEIFNGSEKNHIYH